MAMKTTQVLRSKRFSGRTAFEVPGVGNPERNLLNFARLARPK